MARATRSSARQDDQKPPLISNNNANNKKRKRASSPEDGHPASKIPRTDAKNHLFIQQDQANKILDILQSMDSLGLLERVYPLSSNDPNDLYSLRGLLKQASEHSLAVLQSSVNQLLPISSNPRASSSATAEKQTRFCHLALSLLEQAASNNVQIPLDVDSLLPTDTDCEVPQDLASTPTVSPKYALVQHLPQGDYWTSLSSSQTKLEDINHHHLGHAELTAVLPDPSPSSSTTRRPVSTLGSYHIKSLPSHKHAMPKHRRITAGTFLDYGPYTSSFAPCFDHDGVEVGKEQMGEVLYFKEMRRRNRKRMWERWELDKDAIAEIQEVPMEVDHAVAAAAVPESDFEKEVEELLPPEQVKALKDALPTLELQRGVQELLDRNQRAFSRLHQLQLERMSQEGGSSSLVEEGSEEWDIAQGIFDSLTLLAALRPHSADDKEPSTLIPPASVLHTLHLTIPRAPTPGWQGTLPPGRSLALRDNATVKVRPAPAITPAPAPPAPAPAPPVPAQAPQYTGYSYGYSTPQQQTQYRPSAAAYAPAPPAYYQTSQQYAQQYAQPQYQQQYAPYASWYNPYQPPAAAAAAATASSGASTPQMQSRPVVVANTVTNNKPNGLGRGGVNGVSEQYSSFYAGRG